MEALKLKNQEYKHSSQFHALSSYFLDCFDGSQEIQKSPGLRATIWGLVLALQCSGHGVWIKKSSLRLSFPMYVMKEMLVVVLSVK